jgi:hypothetical protein
MILLFPNADSFRLAVTTGTIPAEIAQAPARVSADADGRLHIETAAKISRQAAEELNRLGVTPANRHVAEPREVSCWLQVLPTIRDSAPPRLSAQAPILFELPSSELLPSVVSEMLRLGNDRQSFRLIASNNNTPRVLLRVIGPPYYTLLRAMDQLGGPSEKIRAYMEQAPKVWVEIGHSYPLASHIRIAEGQLLLIRAPNEWTYLPEEPFQDIYDLLAFQLPSAQTAWVSVPVTDPITVPLRLAAGNAADQPELWVLRGQGIDQLDALVRDADDRLAEQLTFAVAAAPDGTKSVILRTRPSKRQPPILALDSAVGFKPYWKLPNLYIPAGTRLHPTIRRDAVRQLLADDTDTLVWLYPHGDGTFTPQSVPEDSFRPLQDWVEYVIGSHREPLAAWIAATDFDFEHYVCSDATPPKPKASSAKTPREQTPQQSQSTSAVIQATAKKPDDNRPQQMVAPSETPKFEDRPPSEWKIRLDELEKEFFASDGPLDAPERIRLWPELARANAGLGESKRDDAAICWVNAMWTHDVPPQEFVSGWLRSELPEVHTITAAVFDRRMKPHEPGIVEMRAFAVTLLWSAYQSPVPGWLTERLPAVQTYLEAHEDKLPIRAVWLAAVRLAQLAGSDVLGLARVRDRLLQRLLDAGLSPERDLPSFLRYSGLKDSDRVRVVRERAHEVYRAARSWVEKSLKPTGVVTTASDTTATPAYLDLMFAFGFAKLGEQTSTHELLDAARRVLDHPKPTETKPIANRFLYRAFKYRVEQALVGKPHTGLLAPELLDELDALQKQKGETNQANSPFGMADYVIARMREQSRILEPQEKLDPYADWMKQSDELKKELANLPKEKDPNRLAKRIRELYRDGAKGRSTAEARFLVLHEGLPLAVRVGEAFTVELLQCVPEVLKTAPTSGNTTPADLPKKQGQLFERALFLAAHYDRTEVVQQLIEQFVEYVRTKPDVQQFELVNVVARQGLRSLRKLGLRDEIDKLLRRLQDEVLKGKTLTLLRQQYLSKPDIWADVLMTQLHLAGGWLTFGLLDQAMPAIDAARQDILSGAAKVQVLKFTKLVQTYIAALGHGPADFGLPRIVEVFHKLDPARITNTFTTGSYYSRLHLNLVEEVVFAIVSDDFAMGQAGRRWLDEDEYLVRRRIHRDMRRHLDAGGL